MNKNISVMDYPRAETQATRGRALAVPGEVR